MDTIKDRWIELLASIMKDAPLTSAPHLPNISFLFLFFCELLCSRRSCTPSSLAFTKTEIKYQVSTNTQKYFLFSSDPKTIFMCLCIFAHMQIKAFWTVRQPIYQSARPPFFSAGKPLNQIWTIPYNKGTNLDQFSSYPFYVSLHICTYPCLATNSAGFLVYAHRLDFCFRLAIFCSPTYFL